MKKIFLSFVVILAFGAYTAFLRSGDIAALFSNNEPSNTEMVPGDLRTLPPDKVVRTTNCVYINDEDDVEDDEVAEGKTAGHYKCTTTIVPTPTNSPSSTPVATTVPPVILPKNTGMYKDGTFIGDSVDAFYGNVQVSTTISGGRITSVNFLDYPKDRRTSLQKSNNAMPILKSEAISSQSSNVNSVSGATYTSEAFMLSLASALKQAKNI